MSLRVQYDVNFKSYKIYHHLFIHISELCLFAGGGLLVFLPLGFHIY